MIATKTAIVFALVLAVLISAVGCRADSSGGINPEPASYDFIAYTAGDRGHEFESYYDAWLSGKVNVLIGSQSLIGRNARSEELEIFIPGTLAPRSEDLIYQFELIVGEQSIKIFPFPAEHDFVDVGYLMPGYSPGYHPLGSLGEEIKSRIQARGYCRARFECVAFKSDQVEQEVDGRIVFIFPVLLQGD